jgi:hypothetical protein
VRVNKVERVQRRFIRYALRGLGWTDTYDLPPFEHRCALLRLDTLVKWSSIACIMFIFDILSGTMNSPNLLSALDLNTPGYRTWGSEFLRIGFHRTSYGVHEPMSAVMREFNEVIGVFDFILTRNQFVNRLQLTLYLSRPNQIFIFRRINCALHGSSYGLTYSVGVIVDSSTHCRDRNYPLLVFCVIFVLCLKIKILNGGFIQNG